MRLKWYKGTGTLRFTLCDREPISETFVCSPEEKFFCASAFFGIFLITIHTSVPYKDGTRLWYSYLKCPCAEGKDAFSTIRLLKVRGTLKEVIAATEKLLFRENFTADLAYVPSDEVTAETEADCTGPGKCPICGADVRVYGPMDKNPQWYDEDAGYDPVSIVCDCGLNFSCGSYDYQETFKAFNKRVKG